MVVVVTLTLLGGLGGEELREGLEERLCVVLFICVCTRLKWKRVREREMREESE